MIAKRPTIVRLRYPLFRGASLELSRFPKYLRFAFHEGPDGKRKWDALDQLDDEPRDGETFVAGIFAERGMIHVDYTHKGRRVGEWWPIVDYEFVSPQPSQETMRDTAKWREWCYEQVKETA